MVATHTHTKPKLRHIALKKEETEERTVEYTKQNQQTETQKKRTNGGYQKTKDKMAIKISYNNNHPNVNGLNSPIKSHTVADWIKSQNPTICCLKETDTCKLQRQS